MILRKVSSKKGVSLMISYVLLVVIAIVMSVVVFSYLRFVANVEPVIDCQEGTSLIIEDYVCSQVGEDRITLTLRNNGRFSIKGFASTFGGNSLQEPTVKLLTSDTERFNPADASYIFENPLKPGELVDVNFGIEEVGEAGTFGEEIIFSFLKKIKIQPYVYDEEADLDVPCSNAIIRQDIQNCQIKEFALLQRPIAEYDFPDSVPDDPEDENFQVALEEHLDEEGITVPIPTPRVHYEFEDNLDDTQNNADIQQSFPTINSEIFSEGYIGKAMDFNGEYNLRTRRKEINNDISALEVSVSFWLKKGNDNSPLIKKGNGLGFQVILNDSKIIANIADADREYSVCDKDLPNQWQHVTVTGKKDAKERIYINGELCIEGNAGNSTLKAPGFNLFMGDQLFVGQMDDVKIWKIELTAEEVASLYSSYIN